MKVKALRYKKEHNPFQEFVHIEEQGGEPVVYSCGIPRIQPESATIEDMKKMFAENDYYEDLELDFDKVELVEFELIETGVVGADIRNKLSPAKNLVSLLETYENQKNTEMKKKIWSIIKKEMEQSKKSIKYISDLL